MSEYKKTFTQYGLSKQAGKLYNGGDFEVSAIVIGDANGQMYEPSETQTELVNQRNVLAITESEHEENIHRFFAVIPQDTPSYKALEIGLIDSEDNLLWVSQCEVETVSPIDNVLAENIIGVQITVTQGTSVTLADSNIQMASKNYVDTNFQKLSEKAQPSGYCPLDENSKVPAPHLPMTNVVYCVADGNLDASGNLDLISATVAVNTFVEYKEANSYSFTVEQAGDYDIALVAGGGGAALCAHRDWAGWNFQAGGGSGAAFVGKVHLEAGEYFVTVGGGGYPGANTMGYEAAGANGGATTLSSNNEVLISVGGGTGAHVWSTSAYAGSGGEVSVNENLTVVSYTINSNGNSGTTACDVSVNVATGGASLYEGYGKGGDSVAAGANGYFKIELIEDSSENIEYNISNINPLKIIAPNGEYQTITSVNPEFNIRGLSNGRYNKFVDENGSELLKNNIYYQHNQPVAQVNDIWVKIGEPFEVLKYNGETWQKYNKVLIGSFVINQNNIESYKNVKMYDNGFNITTFSSEKVCSWGMPDYSSGISAPTVNMVAPYNCFVVANAATSDTAQIYVDNQVIIQTYESVCCLYVAKGNTFRVYGASGTYYPLKGEFND